jgi:hypothetical protein
MATPRMTVCYEYNSDASQWTIGQTGGRLRLGQYLHAPIQWCAASHLNLIIFLIGHLNVFEEPVLRLYAPIILTLQ